MHECVIIYCSCSVAWCCFTKTRQETWSIATLWPCNRTWPWTYQSIIQLRCLCARNTECAISPSCHWKVSKTGFDCNYLKQWSVDFNSNRTPITTNYYSHIVLLRQPSPIYLWLFNAWVMYVHFEFWDFLRSVEVTWNWFTSYRLRLKRSLNRSLMQDFCQHQYTTYQFRPKFL